MNFENICLFFLLLPPHTTRKTRKTRFFPFCAYYILLSSTRKDSKKTRSFWRWILRFQGFDLLWLDGAHHIQALICCYSKECTLLDYRQFRSWWSICRGLVHFIETFVHFIETFVHFIEFFWHIIEFSVHFIEFFDTL